MNAFLASDIRAEEESKVLANFFRDGRLRTMPSRDKKRMIVLRFIAESFVLGKTYSEQEINERLLRFYDDYCYLRRELVDRDLLGRSGGMYWRVG